MIFVHNIKLFLLAVLMISLVPLQSASAAAHGDTVPVSNLPVIYELQTGSASSATQELVVIYNNSDQQIDITGWSLVYQSSTGNASTDLGNFTGSKDNIHIMLGGHGYALAASKEFQQTHPDLHIDMTFTSGISGTSGHVQLLDNNRQTIDTVGYGAAAYPEGVAKPTAPSGKVLQRKVVDSQHFQDTNNNSLDFINADLALPVSSTSEVYIEPIRDTILPISITELLPNPAGTDTSHEYIEFYNPNDQPVSLKSYTILLGPAFVKSYTLPDVTIQPMQYIALNDQETGIVLPNTSASLRIIGMDGSIVMETAAYSQLIDDIAWAYDGSSWYESYLQTPGAVNEIVITKPCGDGYARNPDTNNCQKISNTTTKTSLTCPAGQIRNMETNRCRKVITAIVSTVCEPGKVKNSETGRCKKIQVAAVAKACPEGQERNEETNRCRKIVTKTSDIPAVKDVNTPMVAGKTKLWAAGVAGTGSVSYAAYEWRQEVRRKLQLIKSALKGLFRQ